MIPWNKGLTKDINNSLLKISNALKGKEKSNFWCWQQKNKVEYKKLKHSEDLAEFFGTMLGDGCIEKLERTEKITVSFNRKEQDHLKHVFEIIFRLFNKNPSIRIRKNSQCDDLYIYQKKLSKRLKFPCGRKLDHELKIPKWIKSNKQYLKKCLKGLFETDGDWFIDKKYNTNVIKFTNHSDSLLDDINISLINLGYHPQRRKYDVRLARREEVYKFVDWISFRKYSGIV